MSSPRSRSPRPPTDGPPPPVEDRAPSLPPQLARRLRVYGPGALSDLDLVHAVCGPLEPAPAGAILLALGLAPAARASALRDVEGAEPLVCALELGRRAALRDALASPVRVAGPADAAWLARPHLVDAPSPAAVVLALDDAGRLVRLAAVATRRPLDVLGPVVAAGCRRCVVAATQRSAAEDEPEGPPRPAAGGAELEAEAFAVEEAAQVLGIDLVDWVWLLDDALRSTRRDGRRLAPAGPYR